MTNRALLLGLLVVAVGINYIDRGTLSVAAPALGQSFSLSATQMGWLFSGFFWTYALSQIPAGWVVDRFPLKPVYALSFLLWSTATVGCGLVGSFGALLAMRLLLGLGESIAFPATSVLLARGFPEEQRGRANALVDVASKVGPALSTMIGGWLVAEYGWRTLFISVGAFGLLWIVPWLKFTPHQAAAAADQTSGPGLIEMLRRREVWGTSFAMFCFGYAWSFLLSWLPWFLVNERGFSLKEMAFYGSFPFWAMAASSLGAGWTSDWWLRRHRGVPQVRRCFIITGLVLCSVFLLPAVFIKERFVCLALLVAASIGLGLFSSNNWAATQTLAGAQTAGKWTGVQNAIGNAGGILSPIIAGWLVDVTRSFLIVFCVTSVMLILAAIMYYLLVRRVAPLDWADDLVKRNIGATVVVLPVLLMFVTYGNFF
ncbi:MAG: MFS transporter [Verrucomicrobiota bacterium]